MPITGTVPVTGRIAPISDAAVYPVTDPQWGLGGLRSVGTTAQRDQITVERRQIGMMVYVESDDNYYSLIGGTSNANWVEFSIGVGTPGATGVTGPQIVIIDTVSTTIDQTILKGSSAYALNGDSILLTYAGGIAPATGCAFLTDPSKGSGFPVYFSSASMTGIDFTSQTLTAAVGDSVTIRIVVTGPASYSSDSYDYEVIFGNELRWGATNGASMTGTQVQSVLSNSIVKESVDHEFSVPLNYGDYLYFAHPVRLGGSRQSINNAAYGGMSLQGDLLSGDSSVTSINSNGFGELFYVYRSENRLGELLKVRTTST